MAEFEFPRNLLSETLDDEAWHDWLAGLPSRVAELAERWSLEVGRPFQPGGMSSWVAPARDGTGQRRVLKVGWPHYEAVHEADGLAVWDGRGAVRLVDSFSDGQVSALLLEACEPGVPLKRLLPPEEQDAVLAALLRRLWLEPRPPFRPLTSMCDQWADEAEENLVPQRLWLDPGLVRAGLDLFRELPRTAARSVLLCTDLHSDNVLAARREPWLAIDPKPYVGDPTYDALQHMLNFPERLNTDPLRFVRRMAELLELDQERLRQWLFARCVQESARRPHFQAVVVRIAP